MARDQGHGNDCKETRLTFGRVHFNDIWGLVNQLAIVFFKPLGYYGGENFLILDGDTAIGEGAEVVDSNGENDEENTYEGVDVVVKKRLRLLEQGIHARLLSILCWQIIQLEQIDKVR